MSIIKQFIILSIFSLTTLTVFSQDITADEPGFEGEIIFVNENNNSEELEFQTASSKTKRSVGAMVSGIGKIKSTVSVRGKESTTILPMQKAYYFVYNHGNNDMNPKKVAQLIRFKKKGKNRVAEIASVSLITGAQSSGDIDAIPFKGKKYNNSTTSYFMVVKNLAPGHYGWFVGEIVSNDVHLFSIEGYKK